MRNVMISNCPVKRVMEDALFPKDNRHGTQDYEKAKREHGCLNDRILWRRTATSSIGWEKQIDAERDCCYRSGLLEQEGGAQQRARWKEFQTHPRRGTVEPNCPRPDDRKIHQHLAVE